ncbi:MAG: phosphatase PAP2 family protein [Bdellovibrionales bacterium]
MRVLLFTLLILNPSLSSASIGGELASPWTTKARPWLLGGSAVTLSLVAFKDEVVDPFQEQTVRDKPLGEWSKLGDLGGQFIPNALYISGMAITGWAVGGGPYIGWAKVMAKGSVYAVLTTWVLKYAIHEPRPHENGDNLSFPSGHTTAAFAFASVVAAEHSFFPYGVSALALATLTGYSRINDNKHYLHDVIAGATVGTAYGLGVSYYLRSQEESLVSQNRWMVVPTLGSTLGLVAQKSF